MEFLKMTLENNLQKLIDKVRKLENLANSTNFPEERKAFLEKIKYFREVIEIKGKFCKEFKKNPSKFHKKSFLIPDLKESELFAILSQLEMLVGSRDGNFVEVRYRAEIFCGVFSKKCLLKVYFRSEIEGCLVHCVNLFLLRTGFEAVG